MPPAPRCYVDHILDLYRRTPGTSGVVRRADRRLALSLHHRQVPAHLVAAALLVTTARRNLRPADAPILNPIATLHYFLPVINELIADPPEPGYLAFVRSRVADFAPSFVAAMDHQLP